LTNAKGEGRKAALFRFYALYDKDPGPSGTSWLMRLGTGAASNKGGTGGVDVQRHFADI